MTPFNSDGCTIKRSDGRKAHYMGSSSGYDTSELVTVISGDRKDRK